MNQQTNQANCNCQHSQIDGGSIKNFTEFSLTFREFLPSTSGQKSCNTRITARRFTKTNGALTSDIHSLNFTRVNFSSVISAGSGSRPSVNDFSFNFNTHRVSGFDSADVAPTDVVTPKWIYDFDSIVSNFYLRTMQDQVKEECNQTSHAQSQESVANFTHKDSLKNHNENHAICDDGSKCAGFTSKDFGVGHDTILAQGVINV